MQQTVNASKYSCMHVTALNKPGTRLAAAKQTEGTAMTCTYAYVSYERVFPPQQQQLWGAYVRYVPFVTTAAINGYTRQAHTANLLEIISPVGTNGLLPPHIPDVELVALVLQRLYVKAQRGLDGVDVIPVKLFDDGGLACVV